MPGGNGSRRPRCSREPAIRKIAAQENQAMTRSDQQCQQASPNDPAGAGTTATRTDNAQPGTEATGSQQSEPNAVPSGDQPHTTHSESTGLGSSIDSTSGTEAAQRSAKS
jgi:hypothetical protein